jgi:hypothetical protein
MIKENSARVVVRSLEEIVAKEVEIIHVKNRTILIFRSKSEHI